MLQIAVHTVRTFRKTSEDIFSMDTGVPSSDARFANMDANNNELMDILTRRNEVKMRENNRAAKSSFAMLKSFIDSLDDMSGNRGNNDITDLRQDNLQNETHNTSQDNISEEDLEEKAIEEEIECLLKQKQQLEEDLYVETLLRGQSIDKPQPQQWEEEAENSQVNL